MSGIGLILSIAKDALSAQRYSLDVTAHNIANVNTPGYSRQSPVLEARESAPYAGLILGRGVSIDQVLRSTDQFIENRLMQQNSSMLSSKELEGYLQLLEGLFNENSGTSISAMLVDFWNFWHDISNNPSGTPERIALYEQSVLLSEQFNTLDADLDELERDLTNAVSAGIGEINQITDEIAQINDQIVGMETTNTANDLRDQRNTLVSELSEYIDVKTFEQSNGSLTVITARGCVLVQERSSYDLVLGGDNGDRVKWQGSGNTTVDITDYITKGKLGGWLDMRDEVIAKYRLDLDAVAKEFIWAVNQQHSQGVGLQLFSSAVTGTNKTDSSHLLSTLTYGDKIDYEKDFRMWIDGPTGPTAVSVDMGISTATVSNWAGNAASASDTYTFTVDTGGQVGAGTQVITWSNTNGDTGTINNITAAGTYSVDGTMTFDIGTGNLVAGNTFTVNTNAAGTPAPLALGAGSPSGTANSVSDTYTFTVTTGGTIGTGTPVIAWSNSITSGTITISAAGDYAVDGMTLNFASGTLVADETFTITTDTNGKPTADLSSEWHWTLDSFEDRFDALATGVDATVTSDNGLTFTPDAGYSFGFSDQNFDASGLLAALGINTFFKGDSAGSIGTNAQIKNKDYIAAGKIINNVGLAVPAATNTSTGSITTSGPYTDTANATYTIGIIDDVGTIKFRWKKDDGAWSANINITIGSPQTINAGVTLTFNPGTYVDTDTFTIDVTALSDTSETIAVGDNTNALAITDLQNDSRDIEQWAISRGGSTANSSSNVAARVEAYYHAMVGSIGIISASTSRGRAFNEVMVNKLSEIRDSISAVSIDEEMTNLIKFQNAYAAAAKLITISDEMLDTLLGMV